MVFNPPARLQPTPAEIAEWLHGQLLDVGAAPARISGVATLKEAQADQLSFVAGQKVVKEVAACAAGLLLVQEGVELPGRARVVVKQVWPAMAALLTRMYAPPAPPAGIHPTAIVAPTAEIGEGVSIGPYCVIGEHVVIGARTTLGPHCIVADGCTLGTDCRLVARVTLAGLVHAGARVILHPGCVLGADGFKYEPVGGVPYKIPQVGAVILEDDVEIGANACIDRAFLHETRLGRFCKIDNIVQIAHNVTVGPGTLMAGMVGIAGSVKIGAGCMFGGASGVADQITMGDGVKVGAGTCVLGNVGSGETIMGSPHMPIKQWFRVAAETAKLTELRHRVRRLEERVAAGKAGGGE